MREKMARAMHAKRGGYLAWDNLPLLEQSLYLEAADAALSALDTPTPRMVEAGKCSRGGEYLTFQAMIRAAKSTLPPNPQSANREAGTAGFT